MNTEYVYYCKRGDELEDIAVVRNQPLSDSQLNTLKDAMAKDGYEFTRMVKYDGYQKPDFAACVQV